LINATVNILDYFPVEVHTHAADRSSRLAFGGYQSSLHQKLDQRHTRDSFGASLSVGRPLASATRPERDQVA
jgi:hypothetical protein